MASALLLAGSALLTVLCASSIPHANATAAAAPNTTSSTREYQYYKTIVAQNDAGGSHGLTLRWSIENARLYVAIESQYDASFAPGWVGFGIGEPASGGFMGSDFVQVRFNPTTWLAEIQDGYVMYGDEYPRKDVQQDWTVDSFSINNQDGYATQMFEMERVLVTNDYNNQDRDLGDDAALYGSRLVFAQSTSSEFNVASGEDITTSFHEMAINLFTDKNRMEEEEEREYEEEKEEEEKGDEVCAEGECEPIELTATNTIAGSSGDDGKGTTYTTTCVPLYQDEEGHIVAFEPILDEYTSGYVHHVLVFGFRGTADCTADNGQLLGDELVLYGFTHGTGAMVLPEEAGIPIGPAYDYSSDYASVLIQVHYNHPNLANGASFTDTSGVRMYVTRTKRTYDAGLMQIGDPLVLLSDDAGALPNGFSKATFECPSSWTDNWPSSIYVIGFWHHMHKSGIKAQTTLSSSQGSASLDTEFYSFEKQHFTQTQPIPLYPGTKITAESWYNAQSDTRWGYGADNEMMIHYLLYYPAFSSLKMQNGHMFDAGSQCGYQSGGAYHGTGQVRKNSMAYKFGAAHLPAEDGDAIASTTILVLVVVTIVFAAMFIVKRRLPEPFAFRKKRPRPASRHEQRPLIMAAHHAHKNKSYSAVEIGVGNDAAPAAPLNKGVHQSNRLHVGQSSLVGNRSTAQHGYEQRAAVPPPVAPKQPGFGHRQRMQAQAHRYVLHDARTTKPVPATSHPYQQGSPALVARPGSWESQNGMLASPPSAHQKFPTAHAVLNNPHASVAHTNQLPQHTYYQHSLGLAPAMPPASGARRSQRALPQLPPSITTSLAHARSPGVDLSSQSSDTMATSNSTFL